MPTHLDAQELERRLWSEVDKARFGMLGLTDGRSHMQPMTAFCDKEQNAIWFFTKKTTDLARQTSAGHYAMFTVMAKDQEFQTCIGGELRITTAPRSRRSGIRWSRPGFPRARTIRT